MPANHIWLVRHGQTNWNVQRRWQGHIPTPLNAVGLRQAEQLGQYMKQHAIGAVYTSDLPRAYQTAERVAVAHALTPISEPRLREIDVGMFQGLYPSEIDEYFPDEVAAWRSGSVDYAPPRGESRRELQVRACAAFREITEQTSHESVVMVAHGGTIRLMLQRLCPNHPAMKDAIPVPNASFTRLARDGSGWDLVELTATPHLNQGDFGGNTSESSF